MDTAIGKSKLVLKYLGFLVTEYNMRFEAREFNEYLGFHFWTYTYSFYNDNGCFTIHDIPQRDETMWYVSGSFSEDQYKLLEKKVIKVLYIREQFWFFRTGMKKLAASIRAQIAASGEMFGIRVK